MKKKSSYYQLLLKKHPDQNVGNGPFYGLAPKKVKELTGTLHKRNEHSKT